MKTKEELNAIKQENATMNNKLDELTDEEIEKVSGGASKDVKVKVKPYDKIELEDSQEAGLQKYRPGLEDWTQINVPDPNQQPLCLEQVPFLCFEKLEPIREDDDYNNFRAYFAAHYGKIANKMKIDITTGDAITPGAIRYSYKTILDDDEIGVMAYNTETIIAEKYETIIRRNIGTSRARDFYDLHVFYNLYKDSINFDTLKLAVSKTAKKRESLEAMSDWEEIIEDMKEDTALKALWNNYCANNTYASEMSFEAVMETTLHIAEMLGF